MEPAHRILTRFDNSTDRILLRKLFSTMLRGVSEISQRRRSIEPWFCGKQRVMSLE
jgi:hypothetical protein